MPAIYPRYEDKPVLPDRSRWYEDGIMRYQCPKCHAGRLSSDNGKRQLSCRNPACRQTYPMVRDIPVLICEDRSLFSFDDYLDQGGASTMHLRANRKGFPTRIRKLLKNMVPGLSSHASDYTSGHLIEDICRVVQRPNVLVIGAGEAVFLMPKTVEVTYTDVALWPLTDVVADAHDLPFDDGIFDIVIAAAVLEHVVNPTRVVEEITRVLKTGGAVYANTPFMQQVHMGRYDFTRFTHLGHRLLWRQYDEIRSGVSNGPGMAVAWAVEYFFSTLFTTPWLASVVRHVARFATYPFRLTDRFTRDKAGAFDAASAYYFAGIKRETPLSDKELLKSYKGKQQ